MHFSVSGVDVSPFVPPLVAFVVSFFTSMGGVSGAFLLLPFQMSVLGFTSPSVSATNQLFNIVAIPSGVMRYIREGRMVWPLTWIVIMGTLPGVLIGAILRVRYMPDAKTFKLFVGAVLMYIGIRLVRDLLGKNAGAAKAKASEARFEENVRNYRAQSGGASIAKPVQVRSFTLKRISYEFYGEVFDFSVSGILALSIIVGIIGGAYGIGGGAIVAPFFVAFFGLPVYTIAGATLMGTFITSVAGVAFYQALAPIYPNLAIAPDWQLGILFGIGGAAGMYCGARLQKFIPAKLIKVMLVMIILGVAAKYVIEYLAKG